MRRRDNLIRQYEPTWSRLARETLLQGGGVNSTVDVGQWKETAEKAVSVYFVLQARQKYISGTGE